MQQVLPLANRPCTQWVSIVFTLVLMLVASRCMARSRQSITLADVDRKILLIFNHGSKQSGQEDFCEPNGRTTPDVIKQLQGETVDGREILVYEFCTESIGIKGILGSKNRGRVREIETLVRDFQKQGVPARQIFLAGHSAGAWASLMVARRNNVDFNAVIAFAPANSGKKKHRSRRGWARLTRLIRYMSDARSIPALVYAFDNDEFNDTETLGFLRGLQGVTFVNYDGRDIAGVTCKPLADIHRTAFKTCFSITQKRFILDYIDKRLNTPVDHRTTRSGAFTVQRAALR